MVIPGLSPSRNVKEVLADQVVLIVGIVPLAKVPAAEKQVIGGAEVWRLPPDAWRHQELLQAEAKVENLRVLAPK